MIYLLIFVSTIASHIGPHDHIDTSQENYLSNILMKHANHKNILAIKENHSDQMAFNFRKVESSYIYKLLYNLKANKTTGYDTLAPKVVKVYATELIGTL